MRPTSLVVLPGVSASDASDTINTLEAVIAESLASISGMLIVVSLLYSQSLGHKPYSRLVASFHRPIDWYPIAVLLVALTYAVSLLAAQRSIILVKRYSLVDASLALFCAAMVSIPALILKNFNIFSARSVVEVALRRFTFKEVRRYGLLDVISNAATSEITLRLKKWGHRHHLADPLGPFHDVLMEAVAEKERITLHLYLAALISKVAHMAGVPFNRSFGLAGGPAGRFESIGLYFAAGFGRLRRRDIPQTSQMEAHALHYLVRRAKKLISEWELDNHRQIFIINLADLLSSLTWRRDSTFLMQLCADAILRVCMDYRSVKPFGSFEPVHELFRVADHLRQQNFHATANRLIRILAFLENNTDYISRSPLADWRLTMDTVSADTSAYFNGQVIETHGKSVEAAFPNSLWP